MNQLYKNIAMWLIIIATVVLMFNLISYKQPSLEKVVFSDFIQQVESGNVSEVTIQGNNINGKYKDGKVFQTFSPQYPDLISKLRSSGVKIAAEPVVDSPSWGTIFVVPDDTPHRGLDILHAPDAKRRGQGHELRQIQGQAP